MLFMYLLCKALWSFSHKALYKFIIIIIIIIKSNKQNLTQNETPPLAELGLINCSTEV